MGITSFLPNSPTPGTLAIVAFVTLAFVMAGRIVTRMRAETACRRDYKLGLVIVVFILSVGFMLVASTGMMEALSLGNLIALLGGAVLCVLIVLLALTLLRRPGRLMVSRIPLALVSILALTMYVAVIGYSQSVFANAGGSVAGSVWWNMYRAALVVADVVSIIVAIWFAVLIVVGLIVWPIRAIRRRRTAVPGHH